MEEFFARQMFVVPSFDLEAEEQQIFDKFYHFLDNSGVAEIIKRAIKNGTKKGGRPNVNYYNLFAAVLYGFSRGRSTVRDLADACGHDIRFIDIMHQVRPSYSTIANFINSVIVEYEEEIFACINRQIIKEMSIAVSDAFIDGTKWEANANKYKFVWKPVTLHRKISITFFALLKENNLCPTYDIEDMVRSATVIRVMNNLETEKSRFEEAQYNNLQKAFGNILIKVLEYEEKEEICGIERKSYFKTDHDATAMCLKSDYYTGKGSNLHAAYNVQAVVVKGMVLSYYVSQNRVDSPDFVPALERFYQMYGCFPENVCADSGYGTLANYRFLEQKHIGNYVKFQSWEGNVSGSYPDSYHINEDGTITCLNGQIGHKVDIPGRHPKKAGAIFYKVDDCVDCAFKDYCMRFQIDPEHQTNKIFEIVPEFTLLKQQAEANLLSVKGIEIRINRSIQVEGVFGAEKQDYRYVRIRRRGIRKVSTEIMLVFLGLNLKRLFNYFETGKVLEFWKAPEGLQPESFKKPSAKRLSRKGKRIHNNTYNNKN